MLRFVRDGDAESAGRLTHQHIIDTGVAVDRILFGTVAL